MGLNQIYKVVWSKTKGCYVVVSELAKRVGRNKTKAVVVATAAMAMVVGPMAVGVDTVEAGVAIGSTTDNTIDKGTALTNSSSIAIGRDANASRQGNNIVIGDETDANGAGNVVIGRHAFAGFDGRGNEKKSSQSVAIGAGNARHEGAKAFGDQSVALGANTLAYGNSSIAIGNDDVDRAVAATTTYTNSDGNKVTGTVGAAYTNLTGKNLHTDGGRYKDTKSGEAAVAIGVKAQSGDISVALGTGAQAEKVNAVALGSGATATFDNSVALGGGSVTDKEGTKQTSVTVNGHTYNWSGGSTTGKGDVVSIGKAGYERQLKNVAAGEVSETSTDGINGSQLYGILNNMTIDPTFLYAGDDADKGEVTGADADAKKADAASKKIVSRSMKDSRLNLLGGADKTKLSENNIGVNYESGNTLTFKLAKDLKGLDSTDVGGIVTNADGINMNNKPITNVAGNLPGAKEGTDEPTTSSEGPAAADLPNIKKNAATVGDVLNAGWNLQNNGTAKDLVKPYDTVNFINGEGTTAVVETTDNKVSTVKFDVKLGAGLKKDNQGNVTVDAGDIANENGAPKVADADKGKVATVDTVAKAINDSYWIASAEKDGNTIGTDDNIKPSTKVTLDAGKNIEIDHSTANKFTFKTVDKPEFTGVDLKDKDGNKVNLAPTADGLKLGKGDNNEPANITNVTSGLKPYAETTPDSPDAKKGLVDLSKPKDGSAPTVSDNTAATVGDLRNMGWVVSADKTTGNLGTPYSEAVKNANEVKFVGTGSATVSGKTDENGVRTITVDVNDQAVANNAAAPVVYTDENGDRVYPTGKKDEKGNPIFSKNPDGSGAPVTGPIKTSINGPEGTKSPTTLDNVAGNLPGAKKDTEAPTTTGVGPTEEDAKKIANNAATVGDVLNAGWNLQGNGKDVDFVKPYDTVNFIDGEGTTAVVETKDNKVSTVKFDVKLGAGLKKDDKGNITVDAGDITNENGAPKVADTDKGKGKVATVDTVAKAINDSYWIASAEKDGKTIGANDNIKPSTKVTFDAGKNIEIDHSTPNKFTFKTVDNPEFKSIDLNDGTGNKVNLAPTADGLKVGKGDNNDPVNITNVANGGETFKPADDVKLANDGKWYPADQVESNGQPKEGATPAASPLVTKNEAGDILEKGNDGNWYKANDLVNGEPKPNVNEQKPVAKPENADKAGLVNFANSNPNNVATVGDLQNMGFVVAAKDNGYTEQVRNANKVEFTGSKGVSVTGKTLKDGTREINVSLKEGRVTNNVIITDADGNEVKAVRGADGKIYKKDPKTGKAMKEEFPLKPTDTVRNDGDAYVTGNSVATAIQKSGWDIGIGSTDKEFTTEEKTYERVNPKDKVKFANGDNTTVSMVVDAKPDRDGATVTTTYVKVDVNRDLKLDSVTTTGKDGSSTKMDGNGITITPADKTKRPVSLTNNGLDNGNNRITNVAQGIDDTDAVNVSQLKGVANAVAEVGNRVNRSGAQAAALAGLQTIQYDPLEPTQISAGVGHYKGSSALALGVNHYKNESTLFHVGASFNGRSSETMANASVTWKFGSRADETAVKDTFRQGPISASYTLQDKVSALEVQNSAQKDEIAELRALAATQQAQIAELFKRLNEKA
ncbi:ESPR-type extended signal peptide-containing protein [Veillonella sp. 3310]|uniref:ESPR-type extended signal peptide-containing protein n=1 Tax=Veillonella sp. 3310 TaxID=2490956 RepID=UPI000FD67D25|nr:ESPR-type extended signal peptide-containing protein [Veillonella sp. 3310]